MALRGSVFDIFGTLVDWRSGITDAFRAARVPGELAELADAWRARYRSVLAEVNRGAWPWGNFDELHLATSHDLLDERGVELPVEECRLLVRAWHRLPPWPDVHLGLEAMRRHHVTSALSSRHLALLVTLTRHAGLRFDCLLSAELAHAYKPAPEAYLTATRLGPQGGTLPSPATRHDVVSSSVVSSSVVSVGELANGQPPCRHMRAAVAATMRSRVACPVCAITLADSRCWN
jgi:2-haloacid dehalogenase